MAKKSIRPKVAGVRQAAVHYDQALPEIPGRKPYQIPNCYLEKDGKGGYTIVPGRRPSKLLLAPCDKGSGLHYNRSALVRFNSKVKNENYK